MLESNIFMQVISTFLQNTQRNNNVNRNDEGYAIYSHITAIRRRR